MTKQQRNAAKRAYAAADTWARNGGVYGAVDQAGWERAKKWFGPVPAVVDSVGWAGSVLLAAAAEEEAASGEAGSGGSAGETA